MNPRHPKENWLIFWLRFFMMMPKDAPIPRGFAGNTMLAGIFSSDTLIERATTKHRTTVATSAFIQALRPDQWRLRHESGVMGMLSTKCTDFAQLWTCKHSFCFR